MNKGLYNKLKRNQNQAFESYWVSCLGMIDRYERTPVTLSVNASDWLENER